MEGWNSADMERIWEDGAVPPGFMRRTRNAREIATIIDGVCRVLNYWTFRDPRKGMEDRIALFFVVAGEIEAYWLKPLRERISRIFPFELMKAEALGEEATCLILEGKQTGLTLIPSP